MEKSIMQQLEELEENNLNALLELVENSLKLLSLVHMRYRLSLDDRNDYYYFWMAKTNAAVDKDNYYKIFSFYVENIFSKTLMSLLNLANDKRHSSDNITAKVVTVLQELCGYQENIKNQEDVNVRRATEALHKFQIKSGFDKMIIYHESLETNSGLRHRVGKKSSPTTW